MPNIIKYSLTSSANSIKSGNFNVAVNNTATDLTGFYNGICPINGGYTIYVDKVSGGPSIYAPKDDATLIQITNSLGASVATASDALVWINSQSTMTVLNNNYPSIVTSGLVMNLDAGFVSSYPKTGTSWKDLSGSGNTGTLLNGITYSGISGGSLVFDGVDDRVTISSIPGSSFSFVNNSFTVSLWVYVVSGTSQGFVSSNQSATNGGQYSLVVRSGGIYSSFYGTPTYTDLYGGPMVYGSWCNVVNTFNYTTSINSIYVNGVLKGSGSMSSSPLITTAILNIGYYGFGGAFLKGNIAQTKIYNRALSTSEVLQNYYAGLQRFIPTNGLVLSLDAQNTNLYATSPTTAYDVSGNDNNGVMLNGVQYVANGNGSWRFDGVDDSIIVTSKPTNYIPTSGNFTIIGWINRNSIITPLGDRESIFSNTGSADGFRFQIGSGGVLFSLIGGVGGAGYTEGSMGSGYNVADGNWHQVGVMFDRTGTLGSYKAYAIFDGTIIGNRNISSTNNVFTNQNAGISYACCSTYKGSVSTLSVYSNLLTETEITTIYNATKSRYGL